MEQAKELDAREQYPEVTGPQFSFEDKGVDFDTETLFEDFLMDCQAQPDKAEPPENASARSKIHLPKYGARQPDPGPACTEDAETLSRRVRSRAGDVANMREMLVIPTDDNYQYAISTI